jgi:3-methyladenine DNA glycosylase AlkD
MNTWLCAISARRSCGAGEAGRLAHRPPGTRAGPGWPVAARARLTMEARCEPSTAPSVTGEPQGVRGEWHSRLPDRYSAPPYVYPGEVHTEGTQEVVRLVRALLEESADLARAAPMQAYMKSGMPFYGVSGPEVGRITGKLAPPADAEEWSNVVLQLWRQATHREERYVALVLAADRPCRRFRTIAALPRHEELVVTGAWWDLVDPVAPLLGELLPEVAPALRDWACCDNIWKRRAAIIAQRRLKQRTDAEVLFACIEPSRLRGEFWLSKAIRWALQEYAKTAPEVVRGYVLEHELSPLSRREALKHL